MSIIHQRQKVPNQTIPTKSQEVEPVTPESFFTRVSLLIPTDAFNLTDYVDSVTTYGAVLYGSEDVADPFSSYLYRTYKADSVPGYTRLFFTAPNTDALVSDPWYDYILDDEKGIVYKETRTVADRQTQPPAGAGESILQKQVEDVYSEQRKKEIISGSVVNDPRFAYEFDPKTAALQTIKTEILETLTPPTQAAGSSVTQKQIDRQWSERVTKSISTATIEAYGKTVPSSVNVSSLQIPPTLTGVAIVWAEGTGAGDYAGDWSGSGSGVAYSLSGSEQGTAEGNASYIPDLLPIYVYPPEGVVDTVLNFFYLANPVSLAGILTKLGATRWPVFHPKTYSVSLIGQKLSVSAKVSANAGYATSSGGTSVDQSTGSGKSFDVSNTHQVKVLGPCLNGNVSFSGTPTKTANLSVTATVGWTGVGGFPTVAVTKTATKAADASVNPTSITATTPVTHPVSGLYLIGRPEVTPAEGALVGYSLVVCETLNAALLA